MSIEALQKRAKAVRARAAVRAWEYRQRKHSKGVWFRLRRVLAHAAEAYAVTAEQSEQLLSEGYSSEAVGAELQPPKIIVFAPPERVAAIRDRRSIALRLGGDVLREQNLVLVPFVP